MTHSKFNQYICAVFFSIKRPSNIPKYYHQFYLRRSMEKAMTKKKSVREFFLGVIISAIKGFPCRFYFLMSLGNV